jgi:hypothetical protein
MKRSLSFLVLIVLLTSCQASFSVQPMPENLLPLNTPLPAVGPFEPTPTPATEQDGLPLSALQNAQYHSALWGDLQLTGGIFYRTPTEPSASPELYSTRLFELLAYGDLNADGTEEAVVILQTHNGGNMDMKELAVVINQNHQPYNISSVELETIAIESLQIQAGVIFLQGRTLGPDDPLCCPSQQVTWQFQLQNGQLTSINGPGPTPAPTSALSTRNNLYGIPYDSPTWLIKPLDSNQPFNILVLGVDEKCTLTINTRTNLQELAVTTDHLVLGRHAWQVTRTFQGNQQVDEIYVPDVYPPEYTQAAGSAGFGYAMNGFSDSCRLAIQGILAEMQ